MSDLDTGTWHDPDGVIAALARHVPTALAAGSQIDKVKAAWVIDVPFEDAGRARDFLDTCQLTVVEETRSILNATRGRLDLQIGTVVPARETWLAYAGALINLDTEIARTGELRLPDRTRCSQRGLSDACLALGWSDMTWVVAEHTGPAVRGSRLGERAPSSAEADILATLLGDRIGNDRRSADLDITGAIADYLRREPDIIDVARALAADRPKITRTRSAGGRQHGR